MKYDRMSVDELASILEKELNDSFKDKAVEMEEDKLEQEKVEEDVNN